MKATIETQALRMLAERAARAAAPKPHIPIYSAILLEANADDGDGRLTAKASDGQTWLRDSAPATVETAGYVAVSARLLAGLTAVLPKGVLHLEDAGSALAISRVHSRGTDRWTLPVMHADDFPSWPADPPGQVVTVPARPMAHALDLVGGIVSAADAAIGGLRQMEITADGAGVTVRGTDRFRSASVVIDPEAPAVGSAQIVVAPELAGVLAPLAREYDRVSLLFPEAGHGLVSISAGPVRVLTSLLPAEESEQLRGRIRQQLAVVWPGYFLADRAELIGQLELAGWTDDALVLDYDGLGTLTIEAQSSKDSRDGHQQMTVDVPPDSALAGGFYAAVSAGFLLGACKAQPAERVRVSVNNPAKAGAWAVHDAAGHSPVRYAIAGRAVPASARRAA